MKQKRKDMTDNVGASSGIVVDDDEWKEQQFKSQPGKRFLNTGVALYEIVADQQYAQVDTASNLHLYAYRDVATGTLIKPGEEGLCKSTRETTLVVAKIVAGQRWKTPRTARAAVGERVARQRAEFDLRNGANEKDVAERLRRDLAQQSSNHTTNGNEEGDEEGDDDEESVDWDTIRKQIEAKATQYDSSTAIAGGGDDNGNRGGDDEDEDDEEADFENDADDNDPFAPVEDDDDNEQFCAKNGDAEDAQPLLPGQQQRSSSERKKKQKKRVGFDAPSGAFASYGLLSGGAPSGASVLNIDCRRVDPVSGFASAETVDESAVDHHYRSLLADMDELDRAANAVDDDDDEQDVPEQEEYDVDDDNDDIGEQEDKDEIDMQYDEIDYDADVDDKVVFEADVKKQTTDDDEYDAEHRLIMRPQNIELDSNGRIKRRLDDALVGASSERAQSIQNKREIGHTELRPRRTANESAMLAERGGRTERTLGDDLKDFGLPAEMRAALAQQGALAQPLDESAQFPQSIDEIAHLVRPFKSNMMMSKPTTTTSLAHKRPMGASKDDEASLDPIQRAAEVKFSATLSPPAIRTEEPLLTSSTNATLPSLTANAKNLTSKKTVTVEITLAELVSIHSSITAQMRAIADLSASIDSILLKKMALE